MTNDYRRRTYSAYIAPNACREPKGGFEVPDTWMYDEEWWHALPTNLKLQHMNHHAPPLPPVEYHNHRQVLSERRGQWAHPDRVEVDMLWPHRTTDDGDRMLERTDHYAIPDKEWEELTPDEQRRLMAL